MEIKDILSLAQEVDEFTIEIFDQYLFPYHYPVLSGRLKTKHEGYGSYGLFDKVRVILCDYDIQIESIGDKSSIREIINLLNIDYNKIDFRKIIDKFNEFERLKNQLGDLHLEFL